MYYVCFTQATAPPGAPAASRKCLNGHNLKKLGTKNSGWRCDGFQIHGSCLKGCTGYHQTTNWMNYCCTICDFDLCEECVKPNITTDNQNNISRSSSSSLFKKVIIVKFTFCF